MESIATELAGADPNVTAGRAVREARERLGITQRQLADRLEEVAGWRVDPTAITRIEKGERELRVSQVQALAKALDATPSEFFYDESMAIAEVREELHGCLRRARRDVARALEIVSEMPARTKHEPGLLVESGLRDVDPEDYAAYVLRQVRAWARSSEAERARVFEGADTADVRAIPAALLDDLVDIIVEIEPGKYAVDAPERASSSRMGFLG